MAIKPIKFLELHYTMTQFLIIMDICCWTWHGLLLGYISDRRTIFFPHERLFRLQQDNLKFRTQQGIIFFFRNPNRDTSHIK